MSASAAAQQPDSERVELEILRRTPGRVVLAGDAGVHIGRNYAIRRSLDAGKSWSDVGSLPQLQLASCGLAGRAEEEEGEAVGCVMTLLHCEIVDKAACVLQV